MAKKRGKKTAKKAVKKVASRESKGSESKLFAFLGVFFTLLGFVIVLLARKNDKYAMYYAKQGLVIFIASAIAAFVPIVGWIAGILVFVLWVFAVVNSLSGKMKPTPLIGRFGEKLNF